MKTAAAAIALFAAAAQADITFTRTVDTVADYVDGSVLLSGCPAADKYGSNNCDLKWGQDLDITYNATLDKPITTGSKISVDLKASFLPLKFDCAACGAVCEFKVPIVGKTISIKLPDCPIAPAALHNTTSVTLPAKSPLPLKIEAKGSITVTNGDGSVVAKVDVDATVDKDAEADESDRIELDWSQMFA